LAFYCIVLFGLENEKFLILYLIRIEVSPRIVKGCTLRVRGNTLINMSISVCYAVCQKAIFSQGSTIIHYLGNRKHAACFNQVLV